MLLPSSTNDDHAFQKIINDSSRTHANVLAICEIRVYHVCMLLLLFVLLRELVSRTVVRMCMDQVVYMAITLYLHTMHRAAYIKHYFYGNERAAAASTKLVGNWEAAVSQYVLRSSGVREKR